MHTLPKYWRWANNWKGGGGLRKVKAGGIWGGEVKNRRIEGGGGQRGLRFSYCTKKLDKIGSLSIGN